MPRVDHRASHPSHPYWVHSDPNAPAPVAIHPPCLGACNDAWRAAEHQRLIRETPHALVAIQGSPVWCNACRNKIFYALLGLPYLTVLLALEVQHATRVASERASANVPIHQREAYTLLMDSIWATLTEYEDQVREERQFSPRVAEGVRRGPQMQTAAVFLSRQLDWFLQQRPDDDEGPDPDTGAHTPTSARGLFDRIVSLEKRAQRMCRLDERRPEWRPEIPCPQCDLMALEYDLDHEKKATGLTRCRACRARYGEDRMDKWLAQLAYHGRRWPAELRDYYGIPEPVDTDRPRRHPAADERAAVPVGDGLCVLDTYGCCETHDPAEARCPGTDVLASPVGETESAAQ